MTGAYVMKPTTCNLWPHRQSRWSASWTRRMSRAHAFFRSLSQALSDFGGSADATAAGGSTSNTSRLAVIPDARSSRGLSRGRGGRVRTDCKPRANNCHFGVKKGSCWTAVDAGFPLQYSNFPHGRALSSAG